MNPWAVFYYLHAIVLAEDRAAIPLVRRALLILQKDDAETVGYVTEAAARYTPALLIDESKSETLLEDLRALVKIEIR